MHGLSKVLIHCAYTYVTLDHKTSHKGMVCYDRTIFENMESEGAKNRL